MAESIRALDPTGDIVSISSSAEGTYSVKYAEAIEQHETITAITPEEWCRAYFVVWLVGVGGYAPEDLELERRYPAGRNRIEGDVRIKAPGAPDAYALAEVKQAAEYEAEDDPLINGQLFTPASTEGPSLKVLSLVTVEANADGEPSLRSVTIDFTAHTSFELWQQEGRPHQTDFPITYNEVTTRPYVKASDHDLEHSVSREELSRKRNRLHNMLWAGGNDDNQIYAWLVRFFLAKIHDEEATHDGEEYDLQVKHSGSRKEAAHQTTTRLDQRWEEAFRKHISRTDEVIKLSGGLFDDTTIAAVVETMQGVSLKAAAKSEGDLLGGFFEAITREGFKQDKGLFFTHFNIAVFMVEAVGLRNLATRYFEDSSRHSNDRLPYVIDPSAGSGTFLLAAMRAVTSELEVNRASATNDDVREQYQIWSPDTSPNAWARQFLYGIEKREDLSISAKVNMVLHQDGSTHIYKADALSSLTKLDALNLERMTPAPAKPKTGYTKSVNQKFHVIITNPPFSISLDGNTQDDLKNNFELASINRSENVFIERWYQLLRPGGRLAAVLPESTFSTAENAYVRRFILAHFHIRAVVSLPALAFEPWTNTRTSLLFAQKKTVREEEQWNNAYVPVLTAQTDAKREALRSLGALARTSYQELEEAANNSLAAFSKQIVDRFTDLAAIVDQLPTGRESQTARRALKKLATYQNNVESLQYSLTELGLAQHLGSEDWQHIKRAVNEVCVEEVATQAAIEATVGSSYLSIAVDSIGYRRTKRGERPQPNDLFTAKSADGEMLPNVNTAPTGWSLVDNEADALTIIKKAEIWQ